MPKLNWTDQTDIRRRAWRVVTGTTLQMLAKTDEELQQATGLPLAEYDAMLHTADAGGAGIRMTDLAEAVLLTKAGLTALVDRLEERGFVRREPDPDDRRVWRIVLTDEGESVFREAAAVHVQSIENHFTSRITDEEAQVIVDALERAGAHLDEVHEPSDARS